MKYFKPGRIFVVLLCALSVFTALPVTVSADMGPKASVHIQFKNMDDELCYGTLLSKHRSTGPESAWDGTEEDARTYEDHPYSGYLERSIWEAFVNYKTRTAITFCRQAGR